jgi:hypothetical protein
MDTVRDMATRRRVVMHGECTFSVPASGRPRLHFSNDDMRRLNLRRLEYAKLQKGFGVENPLMIYHLSDIQKPGWLKTSLPTTGGARIGSNTGNTLFDRVYAIKDAVWRLYEGDVLEVDASTFGLVEKSREHKPRERRVEDVQPMTLLKHISVFEACYDEMKKTLHTFEMQLKRFDKATIALENYRRERKKKNRDRE